MYDDKISTAYWQNCPLYEWGYDGFYKELSVLLCQKIKERHIDDKKKINQKKESDDKNR